jgi:hypothetical protein
MIGRASGFDLGYPFNVLVSNRDAKLSDETSQTQKNDILSADDFEHLVLLCTEERVFVVELITRAKQVKIKDSSSFVDDSVSGFCKVN